MFNQISTPWHTSHVTLSDQPPQQKRGPIALKDPTTGKDITNVIMRTSSSAYFNASSTPPLPKDDKTAKIQAEFAEKVILR